MIPPNLRLAILDYPKQLLNDERACRLLTDMLCQKQINFERTSKTFVVTDKHDMIGTHFLIYDTIDLYKPKLVAAIRNTYENRAREHNLTLPIENYLSALSPSAQKAFQALRNKKGSIVDCNAWFVDPGYSHANSNLDLSEILFFTLCLFIYRRGQDHFVGATNERYKASRWVSKVGYFPDGLTFTHPAVPDIHKLTLVEYFYSDWMIDCWQRYGHLIKNCYEVTPESETLLSADEVMAKIESENTGLRAA